MSVRVYECVHGYVYECVHGYVYECVHICVGTFKRERMCAHICVRKTCK